MNIMEPAHRNLVSVINEYEFNCDNELTKRSVKNVRLIRSHFMKSSFIRFLDPIKGLSEKKF